MAAPDEALMTEFITGLWPYWLRPGWLLLLPALGWLLWRLWNRQKRVGRWQMILPSAFHAALLSGGGGRESKLPWVALGLAWLLAVLALLGPSWERIEQPSQRPADPLVVMLELTPEMLAADSPPTRLEQARRKLQDLLQARSDSQTAIIVYAGSAHTLVPLSDDLATSKNLLDAIKPSIMPEAGQRADLAVRKALDLLEQGDLGQGRLLWIGSSLSEPEREGIRAAVASRSAPPLLMLGVGTAEGAPVTQEKGGFLKDAQGGILVPRLDAPVLKDFADSLGGRYSTLRLDNQDLNDLGLLDGPKSLISEGHKVRLDSWADQGYWLLLPLLLLAACAGRRGWLLCLPLLLLAVPQPSYAFDFADLWRRPDQQGEHLLKRHRPAEAARHFEDPRWQGIALYQAGHYADAAQRFAQGSSATDHYNRGNALARSGELEAAIDAYEQALERQPDFPAAAANKALVEQALEQNKASDPAKPDARTETDDNGDHARAGNADQASSGTPSAPRDNDQNGESDTPETSADDQASGAGSDADQPVRASGKPADSPVSGEQQQALEQWLRQIPDEPGELLRRKFWYEQQQHQEKTR
jgi:Ca-activated chloride channel family protein